MFAELRCVACPAVPAVFAIALRVTDETAATLAVEHHHAWRLRLGQLDAGAAQGLLNFHIVALHQAAGMGVYVGAGPHDGTGLADLAYPDDGLRYWDAHRLAQVAREHAVLTEPNQIVAVPGFRLLDIELGSVWVLVLGLAQGDKLAIHADARPGIDVRLRPGNVGVAVIASAVPGEYLGLGQIGDISGAAEAPERQTVANVGVTPAVLQVELVVH